MSEPHPTAGVDIGGTKIAFGVVDHCGQVLARDRQPTPVGRDAILDTVTDGLHRLRGEVPFKAVGVGAPGVIDPTVGTVLAATNIVPGWAGTAVGDLLRRRTGLPVVVANDVHMMAWGELLLGAGQDTACVLFLSIGTGVGGAISLDTEIWPGVEGTAGDVAHLLVPARGAIPCGCGRYDHLEALAAGPAIAARYAARTGAGEHLTLHAVTAAIAAGEPAAREIVAETGTLLGRAVAGLANAVGAGAVTVGGGAAAALGEHLLGPMQAAVAAELAWPRNLPVQPAQLGIDAALLGAALLAARRYPTPTGAH